MSDQLPDYGNEQVFQRNRLPTRAYHIPESSLLLSGTWDFNYAPTPLHAPEPRQPSSSIDSRSSTSFSIISAASDADLDEVPPEWTTMNVPGHWQLQGFGKPQYTNVIYPFPVCPPHVPSENPTGTYRRIFTVPSSWNASSQLRLRFEGVDSAFHLWVNGKSIGYHQGSRNPSEFDVTALVERERDNEVFVRVYQWCDGSYIEDQDQWWLSGIFRDVYLIAFPESRIDDFFVKTHLDEEYRHATLDISLNLALTTDVDISAVVRDPTTNGSIVESSNAKVVAKDTNVVLKLAIQSPRKWTAETPNRYDVEILLTKSGETTPSQSIHTKVGFRAVEIKNGLLTVNGNRILLRGVNRHDHHPHFGRAVPLSYIRQDILLMKQHNINALRCSHYPSHPGILELCDELGLWVMDEADLECHGFYDAVARPLDIPEAMDYEQRKQLTFPKAAEYTSDNPAWKDQYLDRMKALVHRDKNHPSVIVWSLGNEAFYGHNHKVMYDFAKDIDPSRPVHYEGDAHAQSADMFSYMYPSTKRLRKLAETEGVKDGKFDKPIVLCEYGHAMGNGPGDLEGYQQAFRDYKRLQGGFIWEWANHGLWKEESEHNKFYAYGGDFGDIPNDDTFVMDGLCYSNHTPTPGLVEFKKVTEPVRAWIKDRHLVIENGYDFTSLNHLAIVCKTEVLGKRPLLLASGEIETPNIPAGETKSIAIPDIFVASGTHENVWLTVSFRQRAATPWADAGHEIAWCQHQIHTEPKPAQSLLKSPPQDKLKVLESRTNWSIGTTSFQVVFDRARGTLISWTSNGKQILIPDNDTQSALLPGFYRAPTDNDRPSDDPYWKRFGLDAMTTQLRSIRLERIGKGEIEIHSTTLHSPPILNWGYEASTTYRITSDEEISVNTKLTPQGKRPETIPRLGLDLRLSKALVSARYLGPGPGESYPDKRASQRVGVYESSVRGLSTPYEIPQENGNRVDAQWIQLLDSVGNGVEVTRTDGTPTFSWAAGHYTPQALDKARHPCDLAEVDAVLLRLDAKCAGVGSGACGPSIGEAFQVKTETIEFGFKLRKVQML